MRKIRRQDHLKNHLGFLMRIWRIRKKKINNKQKKSKKEAWK